MSTVRQLLTDVLRTLNVVQAGEAPTSADINISLEALNGMLDSWSAEKLSIYSFQPYYFRYTANKFKYTLGPALDEAGAATGAEWIVSRPMDVQMAYTRFQPSGWLSDDPAYDPNGNGGPVTGCTAVSSFEEAQTIDLWHFDEDVGAAEIAPTAEVNDDTGLRAIPEGFTISANGLCTNGVTSIAGYVGDGSVLQLTTSMSGTTNTGGTIEFWVYNPGPGTDTPSGVVEAFFMTLIDYDEGEALVGLYGLYDGNQLFLSTSTSPGDTILVIDIPVDTWTAIALQVDFSDPDPTAWTYTFYSDGEARMGPNNFLDTFYFNRSPTIDMSFTLVSGTGLMFDEVRRSTAPLYGLSYDLYGIPPGPGEDVNYWTPPFDPPEGATDIVIEKLTDNQYSGIIAKQATSVMPSRFYDDGNFPLRTVYLWPIPTTDQCIVLWLWQPLVDVTSLDAEVMFPIGYERAMKYALAMELASEFGKQLPPAVEAMARNAKGMIKRLNGTSQIMKGDLALSKKGRYFNWLTGDTM